MPRRVQLLFALLYGPLLLAAPPASLQDCVDALAHRAADLHPPLLGGGAKIDDLSQVIGKVLENRVSQQNAVPISDSFRGTPPFFREGGGIHQYEADLLRRSWESPHLQELDSGLRKNLWRLVQNYLLAVENRFSLEFGTTREDAAPLEEDLSYRDYGRVVALLQSSLRRSVLMASRLLALRTLYHPHDIEADHDVTFQNVMALLERVYRASPTLGGEDRASSSRGAFLIALAEEASWFALQSRSAAPAVRLVQWMKEHAGMRQLYLKEAQAFDDSLFPQVLAVAGEVYGKSTAVQRAEWLADHPPKNR